VSRDFGAPTSAVGRLLQIVAQGTNEYGVPDLVKDAGGGGGPTQAAVAPHSATPEATIPKFPRADLRAATLSLLNYLN
jgi:hypothetical protein